MWNFTGINDQYYKRLAAEDKARRERQARLKADMPRRMAILARVKRGEITLKEAQRLIRSQP